MGLGRQDAVGWGEEGGGTREKKRNKEETKEERKVSSKERIKEKRDKGMDKKEGRKRYQNEKIRMYEGKGDVKQAKKEERRGPRGGEVSNNERKV